MGTPVVLITGAMTGIGRAAALAFAREGHRIVVAGRHEQAGQDLATELRAFGTEVEFLRADIRHEDDVRNLVDRIVTRFGRLDAAVQSENERNKAVVDQFFRAGIQGPPHDLRPVSASRLCGSRTQPSCPGAVGTPGQRSSVAASPSSIPVAHGKQRRLRFPSSP